MKGSRTLHAEEPMDAQAQCQATHANRILVVDGGRWFSLGPLAKRRNGHSSPPNNKWNHECIDSL
jgi:hypothetical protein